MLVKIVAVAAAFALVALPGCGTSGADRGEAVEAESNLDVYSLPKSSPLLAKATEVSETWAEENIMNGVALADAFKLRIRGEPRDSSLTKAAKTFLFEKAEEYEVTLDQEMRETVEPLTDEAIARAGRTIAVDGFVYFEAPASVDPKIADVRSIVDVLGDPRDVAAVTLEAHGTVFDDDEESKWRATTFLFVNKKTGEVAAFFARQGWT